MKGKGGVVYAKDGGFCLETEVYPDSVNQKSFPCDSILRPGQVYDHRVTYKFFDFWDPIIWANDKFVSVTIWSKE